MYHLCTPFQCRINGDSGGDGNTPDGDGNINHNSSNCSESINNSRRSRRVYLYNMINFINLDHEEDESHKCRDNNVNESSNDTYKFMPPIEAFAFRIIIESLYTGILTNIYNENITSLLLIAHCRQVQHSYESCLGGDGNTPDGDGNINHTSSNCSESSNNSRRSRKFYLYNIIHPKH